MEIRMRRVSGSLPRASTSPLVLLLVEVWTLAHVQHISLMRRRMRMSLSIPRTYHLHPWVCLTRGMRTSCQTSVGPVSDLGSQWRRRGRGTSWRRWGRLWHNSGSRGMRSRRSMSLCTTTESWAATAPSRREMDYQEGLPLQQQVLLKTWHNQQEACLPLQQVLLLGPLQKLGRRPKRIQRVRYLWFLSLQGRSRADLGNAQRLARKGNWKIPIGAVWKAFRGAQQGLASEHACQGTSRHDCCQEKEEPIASEGAFQVCNAVMSPKICHKNKQKHRGVKARLLLMSPRAMCKMS